MYGPSKAARWSATRSSSMQGCRPTRWWRHPAPSSYATVCWWPLPVTWEREPAEPTAQQTLNRPKRYKKDIRMRSFTDIFIKHPVLAVVVNLVIILVGWRAFTSLPVQQYPQIESSSVIITTVYYGASAETVRGFLSTP